jgi:hypothetical protein
MAHLFQAYKVFEWKESIAHTDVASEVTASSEDGKLSSLRRDL